MTLWQKIKMRDWCAIFGHKPTIELQNAVNMKGCSRPRCGVICKVDIHKPCSIVTPWQDLPKKEYP